MVAKKEQPEQDGLAGRLSGQGPRKLKVEPWRSTLETDLMEFCYREGILRQSGRPYQTGAGSTIRRLYREGKAKTIRELLALSKGQYLSYLQHISGVGRKPYGTKVWNATNRVLKKHGFKMYTSGAVVSYSTGEY